MQRACCFFFSTAAAHPRPAQRLVSSPPSLPIYLLRLDPPLWICLRHMGPTLTVAAGGQCCACTRCSQLD
jgi:hypothetical protein